MFNIALLDDEQSALIIAKGAIENFFKEKNFLYIAIILRLNY